LTGPQAIAGAPSKQFEFAVVDVETTGLFPERHDRIVEIAVIRVDSAGRRLDEYCSLVNPNRDLGPTHIHGISAREAAAAPPFEEIAGDVVARLAGAVIVGHNVLFDFRFLDSEYKRLRCPLPEAALLCTMHLSQRADPLVPGRKLGVCCSHFGINLRKKSGRLFRGAEKLSHAASLHYCVTGNLRLLKGWLPDSRAWVVPMQSWRSISLCSTGCWRIVG